jgi:rubrerythrin
MLARILGFGRRSFSSLSEQEVLALAISSEEDDARIYLAYADHLRDDYPQSAKVFEEMAEEEAGHRARLIERHKARFGDRIPLIRREHVRGYYERKPDWLIKNQPVDKIRQTAEDMEAQAHNFYLAAAQRTEDADTRQLLGDLALAEKGHESLARRLGLEHTPEDVKAEEDQTARRKFILTYVQPGLAGLMDGSVSTLAPIFATAFATGDTWTTFLSACQPPSARAFRWASPKPPMTMASSPARLAAQTRIGIRHHDHDRRTWSRLPYLIPGFHDRHDGRHRVVFVELWAIAWIQNHWMDTPWSRAIFQVVLGGALVFRRGSADRQRLRARS